MMRKVVVTTMASLIVLGCSSYLQPAGQGRKVPGSRPVIIDSYAPQVIRPGVAWRIFLQVQDAGDDLRDIVENLWQAGMGSYPASVTPVPEEDRSGFVSFLVLRTPPDNGLLTDRLKLQIVVRDRRGNMSDPVNFPLTFAVNPPSQEVPPKWQTAKLLGAIWIHVESTEGSNQEFDGGPGNGWDMP